MKNLEHLITQANEIKTLDELYEFVDNMIEQYSAGKTEQHRTKLQAIKSTVAYGMGNKVYLETHAREKLFLLIGNVCLNEKVI